MQYWLKNQMLLLPLRYYLNLADFTHETVCNKIYKKMCVKKKYVNLYTFIQYGIYICLNMKIALCINI